MKEETNSGDLSELVRLSQLGQAEAQQTLYDLRADQVIAWARRLGPRHADPEDIAQDVFLAIFTSRSAYRGEASFDAWLYRIVRNMVFRRPSLIERFTQFFETLPYEPTDEEAEDPDVFLHERVHAGLDKLPPRQREILVLYDVEERAASEVAEMLGIPEGTVRSRVRLARAGLAQYLRAATKPRSEPAQSSAT